MRKLLKWAIITFGIAALTRWWRARGSDDAGYGATQATADPAEELRRKLAESRGDEPAEPDVAAADAEASVDDRRAEVHAEGRSAIDEMQSSND